MIFDFFGTLVEVDVDVPTISEFLTGIGYYCSPHQERAWTSEAFNGQLTPSFSSSPSYEDWRRRNLIELCCAVGVPQSQRDQVVKELLDLDRKWTVRATSGALELLSQLRELKIQYALCANWDYHLEPYLQQAGLAGFSAVVNSAEVGARKPHPLMFETAMSALGSMRERSIFVGDTWETDILGSLSSGFITIWVTEIADRKPDTQSTRLLVEPSLKAAGKRVINLVRSS